MTIQQVTSELVSEAGPDPSVCKAGPSAGRAAWRHAYQHPSDLGKKEVDEFYRFFSSFFHFGYYPLKGQCELESL